MLKMIWRLIYLFICFHEIRGKYEACTYYSWRFPSDVKHICDAHTEKWYGMWPYERETVNGGKTNSGGNITTNEYGETVIKTSSSGCSTVDGKLYCSPGKAKLTIYNTQLATDILIETFPDNSVEEILIQNTGISSIHPSAFHILTNLKKIVIIKSKLKEMPDLSKCNSLLEIDFYDNNIQIFRHNSSKLPNSLVKINLIKNQIRKIPDGYFDLPNLKYLALSDNQMIYFPGKAFINNPALLYLAVDMNKIKTIINIDFNNLKYNQSQLVHFNASNNDIDFISPKILKTLSFMKFLELHNNSFMSLPVDTFSEIPKLLYLDLVKNKLKTLTSRSIEHCPKLITIRLHSQREDYQMISVYFDSLKNLTSLKYLWLSDNKLSHFPHPLLFEDGLTSLTHLYVGNNVFTSLTSYSITDFPNAAFGYHSTQSKLFKPFLKTPLLNLLDVESTHITEIKNDVFQFCFNLQTVVLNYNQLKHDSIDNLAFQNTSIYSISLRGNGIQYIPTFVFDNSSLTGLNNLDLSLNKITYILKDTFSHLNKLRTLSFDNNKIVAIEDGAFPSGIQTISLSLNEFSFKHQYPFRDLNLQTLSLDNNKIKVLPDGAFHGLTSLSYLYLRKNRIGRILKTHFKDLQQLYTLDLDYNEIAYIEDGTFASITRNHLVYRINLSYNNLTSIPVSDFWNMEIRYLYLNNNAILKIPKNAFVNITGCYYIYLRNNKIFKIESNGFQNVYCSKIISIGGSSGKNPLKYIESYAFNSVSAEELDLSYASFSLVPSNAFIIKSVNKNFKLNDGKISTIKPNAFTVQFTIKTLDLSRNKIEVILQSIFTTPFYVTSLFLSDNQIRGIHDDAFTGLTVGSQIDLTYNKLAVFPSTALRFITNILTLNMKYNEIQSLQADSLAKFVALKYLRMDNNRITSLPDGPFKTNVYLKEISLRNNYITTIEKDAFKFDSSPALEKIFLNNPSTGYNAISYLPKFGAMPKLKEIYLAGVENMEADALANLTSLKIIELGSTKLRCDCGVFTSLYNFLSSKPGINTVKKATCVSPTSLAGFEITKENFDDFLSSRTKFICTPTDVIATASIAFTIQLNYVIPPIYPNVTINETVISQFYTAVCKTEGSPSVTGTVSNINSITITSVEAIQPGTLYTCYMYTTLYDGVSNHTSANTQDVQVTTKERTEKPSKCSNGDAYECVSFTTHITCVSGCDVEASMSLHVNACVADCCLYCYKDCQICNSNITHTFELDVNYYDFQATDEDFNNFNYDSSLYKNPKYVFSPFGYWLAISETPTFDSFSHWFNDGSPRNIHIAAKITFVTTSKKDPFNGQDIYTFWNNQYWPVDGLGFGSQGQKDCVTKKLQNKGFTSVIRSVITYQGNEHITLAGGEELWVFFNQVLLLQIFHDPKSSAIPCKSVYLNATESGSYIIPYSGVLSNNVCTNLVEQPNEKVFMKISKDSNIGLDVFHAERFECDSQFLFQESGIVFVSKSDQASTKPRIDYHLNVTEDIPVDTKITDVTIGDSFTKVVSSYNILSSKGPYYDVNLKSGNGEDRFKLNLNKYVPELLFDDETPTEELLSDTPLISTMAFYNETIELCSNPSSTVVPFPIVNFYQQQYDSTTDLKFSIFLNKNLDYEVTQSYLLKFTVVDKGNFKIGYVTLKIDVVDVNDNCPILVNSNYVLKLLPPLQIPPLFTLSASDLDFTDNGRISYYTQLINESSTIRAKPFEILNSDNTKKIVWVNKTTEVSRFYHVFAIDHGTPRKGDYITLNITYSATCQEHAQVVVDAKSGALHFIVPKMKVSKYNTSECTGCSAGSYCPGNGQEIQCGLTETTKYQYSYGFSSTCKTCPKGWLCHNGTIHKCAADTHVTCNDTYCPSQCFPCLPGTYCYEGIMYDCQPGTYSDGKGICKLCPPGKFSNVSRAASCQCCPAGYESTFMKTSCKHCPKDEYSHACDKCKSCVGESCICSGQPCFSGVNCINVGLTNYTCGPCPPGYLGNGVTCTDINECSLNPCFNFSTCINFTPGYKCTGCPQGYIGTAPSGVGIEEATNNRQQCSDINECDGENICDDNAYCYNTMGSYNCGNCKEGYVGNGNGTCRLGNYCVIGLHDCKENSTCIGLSAGKFYCKCNIGFAGDGYECGIDDDNDGVSTNGVGCGLSACEKDNCPYASNNGQEDYDGDTAGDVCDVDDDNDNIIDKDDNCPYTPSHDKQDSDNDGVGDMCDNCKEKPNPKQEDIDSDGLGDECDGDKDGDGKVNTADNCPTIFNPLQEDNDADNIGNACDNCQNYTSTTLTDSDQDGYGDTCETDLDRDKDGDSVIDRYDNCIDIPNAAQCDVDGDGKGDICDEDSDNDGVNDDIDNCAYVSNPLQEHQLLNFDFKSRAIGDACANDFDNDAVLDRYDSCPMFRNINKTSFEDHLLVDLSHSTSSEPQPKWRIRNQGRDIEQLQKTFRPSMLVGNQRYGEINFSGALFVNEYGATGDYLGVVFGYQSNKKFYLLLWRHNNYNYLQNTFKAGIKGIQIKVINSATGPSTALENALWHTEDTSGQVKLLWHDGNMQPWEHKTSYAFQIKFKPSLGRIRLIVHQGRQLLVDSGNIYDTSITGGKVGVFTFGQSNVIWSNLQVECEERINHALQFNGKNTYVTLRTAQDLNLTSSFTIGVWIRLKTNFTTAVLPVVGTLDRSFSVYIYNRKLYGALGDAKILSSVDLTAGSWHHCVFRYDRQGCRLSLFLNGSLISHVDNVSPLPWNTPSLLYLGKDMNNSFEGAIDEVSIWKVSVSDYNVKLYMQQAGLLWPVHQNLLSAYYDIDDEDSVLLLSDNSGHNNTGVIYNGVFIKSYLYKSKFQLSYPLNKRRKKRYIHQEL